MNILQNKIGVSILTAVIVSFNGCATNEGPTYDGGSYSQIKRYQIGTVSNIRPVIISDDGRGKFFGMVIGAVLGSTVGSGRGQTLASLGGGVAGRYAGNEIAKANGNELTITLETGESVVVVLKGKTFKIGDKVKIIKDGNNVAQVDLVE
ncbi:MAG: glycine zipper 2TM domain-containing protein [Sulfurimonas sp.]|nr:glycine zipper 2TM domain-containing protein [Sulfurimonas sp.]